MKQHSHPVDSGPTQSGQRDAATTAARVGLPRRQWLLGAGRLSGMAAVASVAGTGAAGLIAGLAAPGVARAADWPTKTIRFIVPFTPGGANDLIGRAAAEGAAKELKQQIIVENKPGAGTIVGAQAVARAAPDGYTFLVSSAGVLSNSQIRKSMPYKDEELVPVAMIALAPSIIFVSQDSKYKTLKELIDGSRQGKGINFATAGMGSTPHFVGEMLRDQGAKIEIVPYKSGSEAVTAVIGQQVDATSEASIVVLPQLKAGKVRALASTWTQRMTAAPELTTAIEQGFGNVEITHWAGVHAPRGTPQEIIDRMAGAIDAAIKAPETSKRLKDLGIEPIGGTRADFETFIAREKKRLGDIARNANMHED